MVEQAQKTKCYSCSYFLFILCKGCRHMCRPPHWTCFSQLINQSITTILNGIRGECWPCQNDPSPTDVASHYGCPHYTWSGWMGKLFYSTAQLQTPEIKTPFCILSWKIITREKGKKIQGCCHIPCGTYLLETEKEHSGFCREFWNLYKPSMCATTHSIKQRLKTITANQNHQWFNTGQIGWQFGDWIDGNRLTLC